jgi:hypothetical protein
LDSVDGMIRIEETEFAMERDPRNYLVFLIDEPNNRCFVELVKAATGLDAGMHALSFDSLGDERSGGGYKVVAVLSSKDLRRYVEELDALVEPVCPSYDRSDIELDVDIIISD